MAMLLQFFEQQHTLVCEGLESSETHHGQDIIHYFSVLSSFYDTFKWPSYGPSYVESIVCKQNKKKKHPD